MSRLAKRPRPVGQTLQQPNVLSTQERNDGSAQVAQLQMLMQQGHYDEVERQARWLTLNFPNNGSAWRVLGQAMAKQGKDALPALERAVTLQPKDRGVYAEVWAILNARADIDAATLSYESALKYDPEFVEAHINLANVQFFRGHLDVAETAFQRALALQPGNALTHFALGNVYLARHATADALACFQKALEIDPRFVAALANSGITLQHLGRNNEAIVCFRHAIQLRPTLMEAHVNLGNALHGQGEADAASASFRRALEIDPNLAEIHSSYLFSLSNGPSTTPEQLFQAHRQFARHFEPTLQASNKPCVNIPDAHRSLKIGFVSADFRDHAVVYFVEPILAQLRGMGEVSLHAYYNHTAEDDVTHRLKTYFQQWSGIVGMSDDAVAQQIRHDNIDILIDLSGHTARNRLLVFARKPAPVQVSWVGYPNTTGLEAMDYVFCDRFNAPYGRQEPYYTEKFARLPSSGTFVPHFEAPDPSHLPALKNGYLTFASFNSPRKLGDAVIAAWARVLHAVPHSVMLLGNIYDESIRFALIERFGAVGIVPERLTFRPDMPMADYLSLHHTVDIVLDTWPYSGGTTTNFALWMGVPVVTLVGPLRTHCQSAAVLGRCGLANWIAQDVDEFVAIAVQNASALYALERLRLGLRDRLRAAPLCQPATVANGVARAMRIMWQRWCAGLPVIHFEVGSND